MTPPKKSSYEGYAALTDSETVREVHLTDSIPIKFSYVTNFILLEFTFLFSPCCTDSKNSVAMNEILGHCAPFQIIKSVVILFSIFVVRLVSLFWWSDECEKYKSMYKKRMSCAMFAESDDQISCPDTPRLKNLELPASMRLATCNDPSITYQVLNFVTRNWTPFFQSGSDLVRHVAFHVKVACSEMRTASNRSHFAMSQAEA